MSLATLSEEIGVLIHSAPFLMFNIVANVTVLLWDISLTFGDEIEFIWKAKYVFTKALFIIVRHLSLILALGTVFLLFGVQGFKTDLCPGLIWFMCFTGTSVIACANILMINRAYAFYGRNKYLLYLLLGAFFINEAFVFAIIGIAVPDYHIIRNPLPPPFPRISGQCISVSSYSSTISYVWLSELVFQTVVFICVIARYIRIKAQNHRLGVNMSKLYTVFLRDGIYVYVSLSLTYCLCVVYTHDPSYTGLIFGLWSFTAASICCTRLILNLHASGTA